MKKLILAIAIMLSFSVSALADQNLHSGWDDKAIYQPIVKLSSLNFVGRIHANLVENKILGADKLHPAIVTSISTFIGFAPVMFFLGGLRIIRRNTKGF